MRAASPGVNETLVLGLTDGPRRRICVPADVASDLRKSEFLHIEVSQPRLLPDYFAERGVHTAQTAERLLVPE